MEIITHRLRLRNFLRSDIGQDYLSWLNDTQVTKYSNQRFKTHTVETCKEYLDAFNNTGNDFLLIEAKDINKAIGTITIYRNKFHMTADIGLMVGERSSWGRGYGKEAWVGVMQALLKEPGLRKITGGTARPNKAMICIMEQSGMVLEAIRKHQELIDGKPIDLMYYARFTENPA